MADLRNRGVIREAVAGDRVGLDAKAIATGVVRESLAGDRTGLDAKAIALGVVREVLFSERPDSRAATTTREALMGDREGRNMAALHRGIVREVLFKQPAIAIRSVQREWIIEAGEVSPLVEQYGHASNLATVATDYTAPPLIQSNTSSGSTFNISVQGYTENAFPFGPQAVKQAVSLAVTADVQPLPLSPMDASQVISASAIAAELGLYPPTSEVRGPAISSQLTSLVVISTEIPYVPPIGAYTPSVQSLAVLAADYGPLPVTPTYSGQTFNTVVSAHVEPLPRSTTRAIATRSAAVQANVEPFPRSTTSAVATRSAAVQAWDEVDTTVGTEVSGQTYSLAVAGTVMDPRVGDVINAQMVSTAVVDSAYPPVAGMVSLWVPQVVSWAAVGADYLVPGDTISECRYAFANTGFTQQAPAEFYPDPDTMYQDASQWFAGQVVELATGSRAMVWPVSYAPAAQVVQRVVQAANYPPIEQPEGVIASLLTEQVACVAVYPSTDQPDSDLIASLVGQQTACAADYPPAGSITVSTVRAGLVAQQVGSAAVYPDKDIVYSFAVSNAITQLVATGAAYADKDTVLSYAGANQVSQQITSVAVYLDKDAAQSYAVAHLATQQVVCVAEYPPKADVGSAAVASMVAEQVACADHTLYGFQPLPRRRAPVIITRYIWSN